MKSKKKRLICFSRNEFGSNLQKAFKPTGNSEPGSNIPEIKIRIHPEETYLTAVQTRKLQMD